MSDSGNKQISITFDTATIVKVIAVAVATVLLLTFLDSLAKPLVLIFISFFLALALNPAVSWIAKHLKSKSRVRATGAAYIIVMAFLITFFATVMPPLFKQTSDFIKTVPATLQELKSDDTSAGRFVQKYNLEQRVDELSADIAERVKGSSGKILSTVGAVGTTVVSIVVVFVLTFMMLVEGPQWLDKFLALQPARKREHRKQIAHKMYRVVTAYVNGQLLIALIGGVSAFIALVIASAIYDVSINAIALAGIVALFALLPLIGTITGAAIVVLASLFVSVPLALTMAVFFIIYQQIENITIQPYIQSRNNHMTPLLVLMAAMIGVSFGGILGALVAIPVAGSIKVLVEARKEKTTA